MIASLDRGILKQSLNGMGGADADRPFRQEIRSSYAVAAARASSMRECFSEAPICGKRIARAA